MNTTLCTNGSCRNTSINLSSRLGFSSATIFMIGGTIGIIPNIIIVVGINLKSSLHRSTFFLIANLAICDLMLGLSTILNVTFAYIDYRGILPLDVHLILCRAVVIFLNTWSYTASIQTLTIISIERFLAIFRPTKVLTPKRAKISCLLAWAVSLTVSIPSGIYASIRSIHLKFCTTFDVYTPGTTIINLILFILQFALPAILMVTLYSLILRQLSTSRIAGQAESIKSRKLKRRTIYMLITTTFVFLALAAPWAMSLAIVVISGKLPSQIIPNTNNPTIRSIVRLSRLLLPYTTLYSPLIYCIFNSEIRRLFIPKCLSVTNKISSFQLTTIKSNDTGTNNAEVTPKVLN